MKAPMSEIQSARVQGTLLSSHAPKLPSINSVSVSGFFRPRRDSAVFAADCHSPPTVSLLALFETSTAELLPWPAPPTSSGVLAHHRPTGTVPVSVFQPTGRVAYLRRGLSSGVLLRCRLLRRFCFLGLAYRPSLFGLLHRFPPVTTGDFEKPYVISREKLPKTNRETIHLDAA